MSVFSDNNNRVAFLRLRVQSKTATEAEIEELRHGVIAVGDGPAYIVVPLFQTTEEEFEAMYNQRPDASTQR
jgi:hypothetical protein